MTDVTGWRHVVSATSGISGLTYCAVTVEALLDAWEAQDPPSIDAAIQTALTTEATR